MFCFVYYYTKADSIVLRNSFYAVSFNFVLVDCGLMIKSAHHLVRHDKQLVMITGAVANNWNQLGSFRSICLIRNNHKLFPDFIYAVKNVHMKKQAVLFLMIYGAMVNKLWRTTYVLAQFYGCVLFDFVLRVVVGENCRFQSPKDILNSARKIRFDAKSVYVKKFQRNMRNILILTQLLSILMYSFVNSYTIAII